MQHDSHPPPVADLNFGPKVTRVTTQQAFNARAFPSVTVFYAPPFVDMHNRMKEALVLLGRIPAAHVRPPLTPVSGAEREAIRRALVAAGLL